MNRNIVIGAVVGLVIGVGAGYFIPHGASAAPGQGAQFAGRTGGPTGTRGSAGAVTGQILSKDATSLTIKMQDGSTKIVLMGTSTPILKTTTGSASDLSAGTNVVVAGTTNNDGSLTAQSVQIRPAGTAGFGGAGGGMMYRTQTQTQ